MVEDRSVKSALRVCTLLEVFERERRPMRVNEIAQKMEAPQSSTSMLLKTLAAEGYMEYDPNTREYCPSMRVAFLCNWVLKLPDRSDSIQSLLNDLAIETGETVLLARLTGLHVQYMNVIDSRYELRFAPPPGTLRPPHRTAVGLMIMSAMTDTQIDRLLRHYNAECADEGHKADARWVKKQIELAREQGYYLSGSLATPGAGVIAILLPTEVRGQRLAVGLGGPLDRLQQNKAKYVSRLQAAAEKA